MTEPVKRYGIHFAVEHMIKEDSTGEYVLAADYARLEKECERLLELLADWSSHFTGPKVIGGPLSSLRERTDAALSTANGEVTK